MEGLRNLNLGAILWALIIAGLYLWSIEETRLFVGDEQFGASFSTPTIIGSQVILSAIIAVFALLSIWKIQFLWGVAGVAILKLPIWLFVWVYAEQSAGSMVPVFLRTAFVAGVSGMLVKMHNEKKAVQSDEALVEEFGLNV